jgi:hypothetical protein
MNQYIILEDSILSGLKYLSDIPESNQAQLETLTHKFNSLGADFQDTWADDYWKVYEDIREGYKNVSFIKPHKNKTNTEIITQVSELQELAITMNRLSSLEKTGNSNTKALKEIDEIAKQYNNSTILSTEIHGNAIKEKDKCCSKCIIL